MAKNPPQAERLEDNRGASWMHDDLAAYIKEQTGYDADSTTIKLAFAMRNEYRATDRYKDQKEAARAEKERARQEEKERKAREREERKAAKEAEKAEKEAAKKEKASSKG